MKKIGMSFLIVLLVSMMTGCFGSREEETKMETIMETTMAITTEEMTTNEMTTDEMTTDEDRMEDEALEETDKGIINGAVDDMIEDTMDMESDIATTMESGIGMDMME